jgi:hypothetical protein
MSQRRIVGCGRAVPRALFLLAGIVACLGAVAYAAAPRKPANAPADPEHRPNATQLPKPTIVQHPEKMAISASTKFGFTTRGRNLRFQCRLDRRGWKACRSPLVFTGLAAGSHSFSVRVLDGAGRRSRAARFRWTVLEPKGFAIVPQLSGLSALYPGAPPVQLPLTIANPNPVPILVTNLRADATADPPGCTSAVNLLLTESSASSSTPLKVPARGTATVPAPGISAPAIQLRDLPVNQDACQGVRFPLRFTGSAHG